MKVIITGGMGFLGQSLGQRLLELGTLTGPTGRPEPIDSLVLLDTFASEAPDWFEDGCEIALGDVADREFVSSTIDRDDVSVFHLASMVSAGCELDFDAAMSVNLDGARAVFEACRSRTTVPRLVFTSSIVAYGGIDPDAVASDSTKLTPETTYGATKAICELLVNDYTRKGFFDGRSARLPTVVVRPGKPNAAASSWVSGIFREPLNGEACVVPVEPTMRLPISGYRTIVDNLVLLHEADGSAIGPDRGLNLPALDVSASEMVEALRSVADRPLGPISFEPDPTISAFFRGWAQHTSFDRASVLGLVTDAGLEPIIRAYIEDFL